MLTARQKKDLKNFHDWKINKTKVSSMMGISLSEVEKYYEQFEAIQHNNYLAQELAQANEKIEKLKLEVEALEALKRQKENNK